MFRQTTDFDAIQTLMYWVARIFGSLAGVLWAYLSPPIPFIAICVFAVLIDCITAIRLKRRLQKRYADSEHKIDGKARSEHMAKMVTDLLIVSACTVLMYNIDHVLLDNLGDLHLAQYVCAIFCVVQFVSILENESTASDKSWARLLQKFLADKTARHLDIDYDDIKDIINKRKEDNHD